MDVFLEPIRLVSARMELAMGYKHHSVDEYLARLPTETEESRFLRSIPWVLDAGRQDPELLLRDLRSEALALSKLPRRPVFSLLTPLYKTPPRLLKELILSVRCQSWPHWELLLVDDGSPSKEHLETAREWANRDHRIKLYECQENRGISGARNYAIERASGEFLAILDHDDILHPSALGQFARILNEDSSLNLLFSNECQIDDEGTRTYGYFYKPHFDLFTLLRANYVCHFTAIRHDLLKQAARNGLIFRSEYDGAEDHDLFARVALTGNMKARHIPLFLYYWRAVPTSCSMSLEAKPEIPERRMILLDELIPQAYPGTSYRAAAPDRMRGECHMTIRLKSLEHRERPRLLIVVPYQDGPVRLLKALESIERQRHSLNVTVVLSEADSSEIGTTEAVQDWLSNSRANSYQKLQVNGPYHFASLVNEAVTQYGQQQDLIMTLNSNIELKSPEALQTLAMQLLADKEAGVVGLKFVESDGRTVRHAGIKIFETSAGSGYHDVGPVQHPREFVNDEHVVLGVSLSCAMTRRETFVQLRGLDEHVLTSSYTDMDFCCKAIESGLRNYYFGTLTACESSSGSMTERGLNREFELARLHERHAHTLAAWRVRMLIHTVDPIWPLEPAPQEVYVATHEPKPARYKVADAVNSALKKVLGPAHGLLKRGMSRSWKLAKGIRQRPAERRTRMPGPIYRPNILKRRSNSNSR